MTKPAFMTDERWKRLNDVASRRQLDVSVVCENIHDSHNVSAILRSADAFGIGTVDVIGGSKEFSGHPKTSSSARLWVDVRHHETVQECFARLRSEEKKIYVTRLEPHAKQLFEIDWTKPSAIVLGNEHSGVSDAAASEADEMIYIPMVGMVQSLNVSVAAAVCLAELFRQRSAGGFYNPLLSNARQQLLNRWISRETEKHKSHNVI